MASKRPGPIGTASKRPGPIGTASNLKRPGPVGFARDRRGCPARKLRIGDRPAVSTCGPLEPLARSVRDETGEACGLPLPGCDPARTARVRRVPSIGYAGMRTGDGLAAEAATRRRRDRCSLITAASIAQYFLATATSGATIYSAEFYAHCIVYELHPY
jgi:hypothetical protein